MSSVDSINLENYLDIDDLQQKTLKSHALVKLGRLIIRHRRPFFLGASMIALNTFAALLEPRIFGFAIDEAILPRQWGRLRVIGIGLMITVSVRVFAAIQQTYYFEILGQKVTQDLRLQLFSHLERLSTQTQMMYPTGRLLTRVTNDIASLNEMFSSGFVSMICNMFLVVGILIWLLILDFKLGFIALSVFPFLMAFSVYFSKRLRKAYQDSRSKLSALNAFLAENLSGMKIVHLFNRQILHNDRFTRLNNWYAEAQTSSVRVYALFQPTITVASGLSIALVIGFGGKEAIEGHLKLGILVAYFSYLLSLFQPVREIADKWNVFLSGMTSAERVFAIFDWPVEMAPAEIQKKAEPIPGLLGQITFENVWFAYSGENWVLKEFNLVIEAGERIGVVGHTGSGKTTLVSLLMRLHQPQRGRILIDGKDIREFNLRSLRASMGIVQQDGFLFSGTFEENITFWHPELHNRVEGILSTLQFHPKQGRHLLEKGVNYSMGERQMIAFARALAIQPKIWILDEATANMDSQTEQVLQRSVDLASRGRTSILIAHRLATVKSADRIVVLHHGSLIEVGSHSVLLAQDGLYSRLYRLQDLN